MSSAFVTGATGFLGQHLVLQLLDAGWSVRALKRDESDVGALADRSVDWVNGDLCDIESLGRAIDREFDAVFHVAADTSMWRGDRERQTRINVEGTRNVLRAHVASRSHRFVHTSSIAVWGTASGTLNEKTPRDASVLKVNYSRTKSMAEALVQSGVSQGMSAVILNPAHIMGPLDRHNWIRLIQQVGAGRLPGIPPGCGSFADVRQVARAHIEAVERGRSGENYLLGGEGHGFAEVVAAIAERLEVEVRAKRVPAFVLRGMARIQDLTARVSGKRPDLTPEEASFVCARQLCDSSKATEELGYRITPFDQLLDDTIVWARGEGLV